MPVSSERGHRYMQHQPGLQLVNTIVTAIALHCTLCCSSCWLPALTQAVCSVLSVASSILLCSPHHAGKELLPLGSQLSYRACRPAFCCVLELPHFALPSSAASSRLSCNFSEQQGFCSSCHCLCLIYAEVWRGGPAHYQLYAPSDVQFAGQLINQLCRKSNGASLHLQPWPAHAILVCIHKDAQSHGRQLLLAQS